MTAKQGETTNTGKIGMAKYAQLRYRAIGGALMGRVYFATKRPIDDVAWEISWHITVSFGELI